ncbi:hypothetical protein [Olsenella uli]|uniref:hypothetical protein n=1 Tax=Olsenella uli TaxID=133926 RepID=UPI0012AC4F47|nr:hypothetical protein [Olsenella uli]
MGIVRRNPAVYAGLAGALAWASPVSASALSVFGREIPSGDPGVAFVSGAVMGAFCATCVTLVATHAGRRREARGDAFASAYGVRGVGAADSAEEGPVGERPVRSGTHAAVRREGAPSHGVPLEPADLVEVDADVTASEVGGPHRKRSGVTGSIYLPDLDEAAGASALADAMEAERRSAEVRPGEAGASSGPARELSDLEEAAERYVRGLELGRRMASKARGVASVLAERLETSHMDGIPVIERADGTVADLGEPWWNGAMGDHVVAGAETRAPGGEGVEDGLAGNSVALFTAQTFEEDQAAREAWLSTQAEKGAWAEGATAAAPPARAALAPVAGPARRAPRHMAASDSFGAEASEASTPEDPIDHHVEELVWQEMLSRRHSPRHAAKSGPRHMADVPAHDQYAVRAPEPKPRRRFRRPSDSHGYLRVIDGTGPFAHHGAREQ